MFNTKNTQFLDYFYEGEHLCIYPWGHGLRVHDSFFDGMHNWALTEKSDFDSNFAVTYNDDEATVIMVDTNIQREDILPSEKARAYSMKYEAMKHQGKKGNGSSLDEVGEAAGESGKTVQRYIWLARLSDELLDMVDKKKIGLVQGVDISFLSEDAQQWVLVILEESGANISTVQSAKLKEYGKSGELTLPMVRLILTEEKPKERKVTIKSEKISQFFSEEYSSEEIEGIILHLLEEWQKKQ